MWSRNRGERGTIRSLNQAKDRPSETIYAEIFGERGKIQTDRPPREGTVSPGSGEAVPLVGKVTVSRSARRTGREGTVASRREKKASRGRSSLSAEKRTAVSMRGLQGQKIQARATAFNKHRTKRGKNSKLSVQNSVYNLQCRERR